MSLVTIHMSMSLDGFIAGPSLTPETPMGEGGERLHDWMFKSPVSAADEQVVKEQFATVGAVVLGKRTFDLGLEPWGDTPYPVPSFVLTHHPREPLPQKSSTFTFVTTGIADAITQAKTAAGDKSVFLMGAEICQRALAAGLVDEIHINLVPVLLTHGTRLLDHLGDTPIELTRTRVMDSPQVTHLVYRVIK